MPVRMEVKIGLSDGTEVWYEVRSPDADRAPGGLIPLGADRDVMDWPAVADDPLVAFAAARLAEDKAAAKAAKGSLSGRWRVDTEGDIQDEDTGGGGSAYIAVGPWNGPLGPADAAHIIRYDPDHALREIEAKQAIISSQTSDHAPVDSMYGLCCRTCVDWQDAPVSDGGESEFGIAIPHRWPCKVARSVVASWSEHPEYRKDEWAL